MCGCISNYFAFSRQVICLVRSGLLIDVRKINAGRPSVTETGSTASSNFSLEGFIPNRIRNFCIVAHIDHGKSTLADRLMELTGTIKSSSNNAQVLDSLQVERERGITVKAQTVSMLYEPPNDPGNPYLLNLIDTPGHVDFSYEVSRSLAACSGALLLVDVTQGVQAQTVANFWLAFENDINIIPVLNKVDKGNPENSIEQLEKLFDFQPEDCISISAKTGFGIADCLLPEIISRIAPPVSNRTKPLSALIFDSWYEHHTGAIANILVKDGFVEVGSKIMAHHSGKIYEVREVGILSPGKTPLPALYAGQVGYIVANMKSVQEARVGDTLSWPDSEAPVFPGFKVPKPVIFSGLYPIEPSDYNAVKRAVERLVLNDTAVSLELASNPALGQGWRAGFMGLLHMEVFSQRLDQEYDVGAILTAPSVAYKVMLKDNAGVKRRYGTSRELLVMDPSKFPMISDIDQCLEPVVLATIIGPSNMHIAIGDLCKKYRGTENSNTYIDESRIMFQYHLPLAEIIIDFHDQLMRVTSGYGSFDYEEAGYQLADIAKLSVFINKQPAEEFSIIVHRSHMHDRAQHLAKKLKSEIPRQIFDIGIKVKFGQKLLAATNIRPFAKDVTAHLYGGDHTRRQKLLAYQKKGKERLKLLNNVKIPKDTFINVMKR